MQGKFLPISNHSWHAVVHQIMSLQGGLVHDTEGKAGLRSRPSSHKALHVLQVRYISLVEGSYLCVLACVLERALQETDRDH